MSYALTIGEAGERLRAGAATSVELVTAAFEQADRVDEDLGVYLHRRDAEALAEAARADSELKGLVDLGPLHGIPIGIKDLVATKDEPTTAQSLVLDPSWGGEEDAPVIRRLRDAGAVITGKTTLMEFAVGCPDPGKPFPVPRNPWDRTKWTGGSSSGTASGIATGCFLGGIGTDTAGSIRMPAAFCGVTGIKPTYGRVPKSGVVPLSRSLDHVGPLARSARDCALLLQVIAGHDPTDPRSANVPVPDYVAALDGSLEGVRIGVERQHHTEIEGVEPSVADRFDDAVRVLAAGGANIVEVSLPLIDEVRTACTIIMFSEALDYHQSDLRERWLDYGLDTRFMLGTGAFHSGRDLVRAQRVVEMARRRVGEIFDSVDLIVTPTAGVGAPDVEGLSFLTLLALPIFTPIWDALQNPAASVPIGFTDAGLPVGMQVIGRHWEESTVLRACDAYQQSTQWHLQVPRPR